MQVLVGARHAVPSDNLPRARYVDTLSGCKPRIKSARGFGIPYKNSGLPVSREQWDEFPISSAPKPAPSSWQRRFTGKLARVLKINPDSPQRAIRQKALADGKTIYMAVPRLRAEKPFIELDPKKLKCSPYAASSIKGAGQYGRPVRLDEMSPIDLVVCGSVAVNRQGARVGKGGGYSDLEFALLTQEKRIGRRTPIVTSVHPLQIVDEKMPMTAHDIPLNAIVTPAEVIEIDTEFPRPKGIYWSLLPQEKIDAIPALKRPRK